MEKDLHSWESNLQPLVLAADGALTTNQILYVYWTASWCPSYTATFRTPTCSSLQRNMTASVFQGRVQSRSSSQNVSIDVQSHSTVLTQPSCSMNGRVKPCMYTCILLVHQFDSFTYMYMWFVQSYPMWMSYEHLCVQLINGSWLYCRSHLIWIYAVCKYQLKVSLAMNGLINGKDLATIKSEDLPIPEYSLFTPR